FVTLQENNAIATVDLVTGTVTDVKPLGFKNHGVIGLDASDRDQAVGSNNPAIKIKTVPGLFGMYQPDGIAAFSSAGQTYLITANEGDARAYTGLNEEARVSTLNLDATAFPNAATLKGNGPDSIGRLTVTNKLGDTDNDGDFDQLYVYGSRSFSIWKDDGTLVFDSGDSIEQMFKTGKLAYDGSLITFNANHSGSNNFDDRSDNKGPEPESVTLGVVDGVTYAFVGLERVGGVLMYDLTNPASPLLVDYLNSRDFDIAPTAGTLATVGDLGPEGLLFISAANSPTGLPLLVASNEVSGTVAVYSIPEPAGLSFLAASAMLVLRRRR
ncbi:MAG: choice-of-anchor I family protein, partial [Burkholderiales bacterium]|nr:choice-of-anchor I family protein [Phycisphaerae bacterium]